MQQGELALASHQRSQPPLDAHFQAAASALAPDHPVHQHRFAAPFDLHWSQQLAADIALDQPMGRVGDQNRPRLGQALQPSGHMSGIANGGVVHAQVVADAADHDQAAVEADAYAQLHIVAGLEFSTVSPDRLLDHQGR